MQQSYLQLEFRKAGFPIRFVVASLTGLLAVWVASRGADLFSPINFEQILSHLVLVSVFVLFSLLLLRLFSDIVMQMRANLGMFFCWAVVVMVAGIIYLIISLAGGQFDYSWQIPYLGDINTQSASMMVMMVIVLGLPLFWVEKEVYSTRALVKESEITQFSNLGFRIRPHFLFNTLNSVAHLISLHPARAEKALYNLADVFRVVMADKRELVPMKAELELADKYLYLEKTRLGERLQVNSRIDPDALGILVPVLMLQPLLENSVYHGIETRFKGGAINLSVQVVDKQLIIQITNPLPEGSIKRSTGNKVAQENLRDRIYRTFGARGTFDAHEAEDQYTVTIRLPL
ncbi:MAG: histidine kinase [Arenicellales bacterium]